MEGKEEGGRETEKEKHRQRGKGEGRERTMIEKKKKCLKGARSVRG